MESKKKVIFDRLMAGVHIFGTTHDVNDLKFWNEIKLDVDEHFPSNFFLKKIEQLRIPNWKGNGRSIIGNIVIDTS